MKKYTYPLLLATIALCSCSKGGDDTPQEPTTGYGSVKITAQIETSAQEVETTRANIYDIPSSLIPSESDFKLYITGEYTDDEGETKSYDEEFDTIAEYNSAEGEDGALSLYGGNYEATLSDGNSMSIESETNACFGCDATSFKVVANNYNGEVTLNAKLQNSIIKLSVNSMFEGYFSSATFTITTAAGSEFVFDPFSSDNESRIIFVAPDSKLSLSGSAVRASSGDTITFTKSVIGTAVAGCMNSINIEAESVGAIVVEVSLNDTINNIYEEVIELNPID